MAVTIALAFAGKNRLRYLCTTASTATDTGTITTTGAATPDIQTDSAGGVIEQMAAAFTNGYGPFGPGAFTQDSARDLWLSRPTLGTNLASTPNTPTGRMHFQRRTGTHSWAVDANVDGSGHPTIEITAIGDGSVAAGTAYLDIFVPGTIGA